MSEWQTLDTAPRDGTVIFVWHVTRTNRHAAFDTNIKKARYLSDVHEWSVEGVGGNVPPVISHWMPLPGKPKDAP